MENKVFYLNLTQHAPTADQINTGVLENTPAETDALKALLDLKALPTPDEILSRAKAITLLACQIRERVCKELERPDFQFPDNFVVEAMIGGHACLLPSLVVELYDENICPYHAFSKRVVVEQHALDGSVRKVSEFRHLGFIDATLDVKVCRE